MVLQLGGKVVELGEVKKERGIWRKIFVGENFCGVREGRV